MKYVKTSTAILIAMYLMFTYSLLWIIYLQADRSKEVVSKSLKTKSCCVQNDNQYSCMIQPELQQCQAGTVLIARVNR